MQPSDVVCLEDGSHGPTAETQNIIGGDDYGVLESVPSYVAEFADILMRVTRREEQLTESQLAELLTDTTFDLNILKLHTQSVAHCNKNTMELMKNDGFHRILE